MDSGFVHNLNPVIANLGGIELYYYGFAYAIGFVVMHGWLRLHQQSLGWDRQDVYDFSILFSVCVLLIGRLFSVFVYHWQYYQDHLHELFHYWRGGMATHGVLLGAVVSIVVYARLRKISFRRLADEIVIPAAFLLALGRVGNFVNGQICGTVTSVGWAVKFPEMDGFRHPVALYEAFKNLMIIPILVFLKRKQKTPAGLIAAQFVFWYGFLRLFTDIFRDHGAQFMGIGVNQYFNAIMAVTGLMLMFVFSKLNENEQHHPLIVTAQKKGMISSARRNSMTVARMWVRRGIFIGIILFSMVIRSAWTPQVLEQRRANHITTGVEMNRAETSEHKIN